MGAHIAYSSAEHPNRTFRVGKVTHLMQAELSCAVHRMGAQQDRTPVAFASHFCILMRKAWKQPRLGQAVDRASSLRTRLIRKIHLLPKGDMWHSEARALKPTKLAPGISTPFPLFAPPCRWLPQSGIRQPPAGRNFSMDRTVPSRLRNQHAFVSLPRTHCNIACPPAISTSWRSSLAVAN